MKFKRFVMILLYLIGAMMPVTIYVIKAIDINNSISFLSSGVIGLISYYLFAFQFVIASRPKIIEKYFSLDRLYKFHMFAALIAIIMAYIHKIIKENYFEESLKTNIGNISLIIFVLISLFSVFFMINKLFPKIKVIDYFKRYLNNLFKIKYENKILIHNLMLLGLISMFIHILMSGSVKFNFPLKINLIIYFIIPVLMYLNHKVIKVKFNLNNKYIVCNIINQSNNIISIKFKSLNNAKFNYLPGQFLYLRIYNPKVSKDEHPFTISSSPSEKEYLEITVKQLGDFTNSLKNVKVGDTAYIEGPYGCFSYIKNNQNNNLKCFIAGGIGITPFLSMLRYIYDKDKNANVILLWGVRDESEIICKEKLKKYASILNKFKFVTIVSNDENYKGEKGLIDIEKIKKYVKEINKTDFYICGPPIMIEIELNNLKKLNVKKENVYFERFSL